MGVDTSVGVGVGFKVERGTLARYRQTIEDEDNYGDEELLEMICQGEDGIGFAAGGSYYEADAVDYVICLSRLSKHYDTRDIRIIGLSKPVISLGERAALHDVAKKLGQPDPEIGQYMSVLWH